MTPDYSIGNLPNGMRESELNGPKQDLCEECGEALGCDDIEVCAECKEKMDNMNKPEILHTYLLRHIKAGVIDFAIRAEEQPGATVKFYIHPASVSGDTLDFLLWEDPENGYDLLMNAQQCPRPDVERFRKMLREAQP